MKKQGFVVLISSIMISLMLLLALTVLSEKTILSQLAFLNINNKVQSENLSKICLDVAIALVYNNPQYELSSAKEFKVNRQDEGFCLIEKISGTTDKEIHVSALVGESFSKAETFFDAKEGRITFLKWLD